MNGNRCSTFAQMAQNQATCHLRVCVSSQDLIMHIAQHNVRFGSTSIRIETFESYMEAIMLVGRRAEVVAGLT